jgi:hypothetical protein
LTFAQISSNTKSKQQKKKNKTRVRPNPLNALENDAPFEEEYAKALSLDIPSGKTIHEDSAALRKLTFEPYQANP